MFTIQYEAVNGQSRTQEFDGNSRSRLAHHLAQFPRPILAVYEQATPISNAMRIELRRWSGVLDMSNAARDFMTRA